MAAGQSVHETFTLSTSARIAPTRPLPSPETLPHPRGPRHSIGRVMSAVAKKAPSGSPPPRWMFGAVRTCRWCESSSDGEHRRAQDSPSNFGRGQRPLLYVRSVYEERDSRQILPRDAVRFGLVGH